jgi:hypothetical protein
MKSVAVSLSEFNSGRNISQVSNVILPKIVNWEAGAHLRARQQRLIFWPIFIGGVTYFLLNRTASPDLTSEVVLCISAALLALILMLIWYRLRR